MRTIYAAVLTLVIAAPAAAQVSTTVRTLPPNPDSRSVITARVGGVWNDPAYPRCGTAAVVGRTITLALGCQPTLPLPAVTAPWSLDVPVGVLEAGVYDLNVSVPASLAIAHRKLIVQEASPSFSVSPNAAVEHTRVTLKGEVLRCLDSPGGACLAPVVRFGTARAELTRWDRDEMDVIVPAGSGTVDVSIDNAQIRRVAAFHYVDVQQPPAPEFFAPLLVPVFFSGPGLGGSQWDTEISGRNDNDFTYSSPYDAPFNHWCLLCDPPPAQGFPENSSGTIRASSSLIQHPVGLVGYMPRHGLSKVSYNLLVRDRSRQAEALGAEIPVVREEELYDGTSLSLLNVPTDARFRAALRFYTIEGSGTVQLRIKPLFDSDPLVSTQITTARAGQTPYEHGFLVIADLVHQYPALAGRGPLRIEVSPQSPGTVRIWAFVTVTNNLTQHVTVISPQ